MTRRVDPVKLEIFKSLFHSVAEEMGAGLRRSAFSPNITERRDYSCAVFDADRNVLAMGDHMPVHLGSMPASVIAATKAFGAGGGRRGPPQPPPRGANHVRGPPRGVANSPTQKNPPRRQNPPRPK